MLAAIPAWIVVVLHVLFGLAESVGWDKMARQFGYNREQTETTRILATNQGAYNAGIAAGGPLEDFEDATVDRILDVNLRGVVHGSRLAYAAMIEQGHGQIVNISSMAGLHAVPYSTIYAATKHAVVGLSISLREEARRHGVGVTVVCPGVVDTEVFDAASDTEGYSYRELLESAPIKAAAPQGAAEAIVAGALADRGLVVYPAAAKALNVARRLFPQLIASAVERQMRPRGE